MKIKKFNGPFAHSRAFSDTLLGNIYWGMKVLPFFISVDR